jgi:hypothetical protein
MTPRQGTTHRGSTPPQYTALTEAAATFQPSDKQTPDRDSTDLQTRSEETAAKKVTSHNVTGKKSDKKKTGKNTTAKRAPSAKAATLAPALAQRRRWKRRIPLRADARPHRAPPPPSALPDPSANQPPDPSRTRSPWRNPPWPRRSGARPGRSRKHRTYTRTDSKPYRSGGCHAAIGQALQPHALTPPTAIHRALARRAPCPSGGGEVQASLG